MNSPPANGEIKSLATLEPPADCPPDGHAGRIAAEVGNIALNPFEGFNVVQRSKVPRIVLRISDSQGRVREPTQRSKAILWKDHYDILVFGKIGAIIGSGAAEPVRATMEVDVDRQVFFIGLGAIDVQIEAILVSDVLSGGVPGRTHLPLDTNVLTLLGLQQPFPGLGILRCFPAQITHRWGGKWNA